MKRKPPIIKAAAGIGIALLCWYLGTMSSPQELQAYLRGLGSYQPFYSASGVLLFGGGAGADRWAARAGKSPAWDRLQGGREMWFRSA